MAVDEGAPSKHVANVDISNVTDKPGQNWQPHQSVEQERVEQDVGGREYPHLPVEPIACK